MLGKSKNSLSCLKMSMCKELSSLKVHSSSLKKTNVSRDGNTPVKISSKMSESIVSSVIPTKDSASAIKHIINKARKQSKGKTAVVNICPGKVQKLKKKGYKNTKEQQAMWQLSCTSTKCNDSKEESPSLSLSELVKQNKQYQQTINQQRQLILKLERIIDDMC